MTDRPGEPSLLDDLERHVRRAHWTDAARALQSFVAAHESVHDGYRDVVARILTRILEQFGPDAVEQLNEAHATWQGLEPIMSPPPRDLVRRIGEHCARTHAYRLLFHDTHHRSVTDRASMAVYNLRHYDGVLAFGEVIRQIYLASGWTPRASTRRRGSPCIFATLPRPS